MIVRQYSGNEKWKPIKFGDTISESEVHHISSFGRVMTFNSKHKNGTINKLFAVQGYLRLPLMQKTGKRTARYIHKLVAEAFIEKKSEYQQYVIHLDYDKSNNHLYNLAWATKEEKEKHRLNNPKYKSPASRVRYSKLNEGRVKMIKRKLLDPDRKTRLKMIAKQFGISEMQLHRIKTGENWGYVTID